MPSLCPIELPMPYLRPMELPISLPMSYLRPMQLPVSLPMPYISPMELPMSYLRPMDLPMSLSMTHSLVQSTPHDDPIGSLIVPLINGGDFDFNIKQKQKTNIRTIACFFL